MHMRFLSAAKEAIENQGGSVAESSSERTNGCRPDHASRRLPLNRELKNLRVGKAGGPSVAKFLATLESAQES